MGRGRSTEERRREYNSNASVGGRRRGYSNFNVGEIGRGTLRVL